MPRALKRPGGPGPWRSRPSPARPRPGARTARPRRLRAARGRFVAAPGATREECGTRLPHRPPRACAATRRVPLCLARPDRRRSSRSPGRPRRPCSWPRPPRPWPPSAGTGPAPPRCETARRRVRATITIARALVARCASRGQAAADRPHRQRGPVGNASCLVESQRLAIIIVSRAQLI